MFVFDQISKRFGSHVIADQISLTVAAGEIVAILGKSGSGKSTLLHMAAGLQQPDSGEIWLNQECITNKQPEKREIAMMFQDFALLPHLNVWQNVALGLRLQGIKQASARIAAMSVLHQMGLAHYGERSISQLSGGEQQRVALARALVVSPKLLLLDEPFSSLDTHLRQYLQREISDLVREKNIPALLVSHDPAEAALTAQKMALLANGQIIQYGTPAQLFARPVSAQAARLLGCVNVFDEMYIPPQAIVFDDKRGIACQLVRCFRQPLSWRVQWIDPRFGELVAFVHDDVASSWVNLVHVWIDPSQIINFQAA